MDKRKYGKNYANVSLVRLEDVNVFLHLWILRDTIMLYTMAENDKVYTHLDIEGFGFQGQC